MGLKTAIVTGSAGAIGKAIARLILATGKFRVIMITRDEGKAFKARDEIIKMTGLNLLITISQICRERVRFSGSQG